MKTKLALLTAITLLALPLAQASAAVKITKIHFDPAGSDTGSNSSLNAEYIVLKNTGSKTRLVGRWTVRDTANHVYKFPRGFKIGAGKTVTIHTGSGSNGSGHRYWGQENYVWNNDGDTAKVKKASGSVVDTCSYGDSGSYKLC